MSRLCYQTSNVPLNSTQLAPCAGAEGTDAVSLCCTPSEICLTNGLCATNAGLFYSGGCTDSTYKAAVCPKFCTTPGDSYVVECAGPDSQVKDGDFCCSANGDADCCKNASNALGLQPSVSSAVVVASPTSVGVGSSSSAGSSTSTRTLTLTSAHSAVNYPSSTSPVPTAAPTKLSTVGPLALGLGLGLGIPVAMFAIFLLWRYLKRSQSGDRTRQMSESMRGIATSENKPAVTEPSNPSKQQATELPNSQSIAVPSSSSTMHLGEKPAGAVEMSTDTEVPMSRDNGSMASGSRIVPDHNPRRPQDGYLGAVTATQTSRYLLRH